jgi:hypothetical protein
LRELRPFWTKADPDPLPAVERLAKHLSIDFNRYRRKSVVFARVEAGLIRRRRELAATQVARGGRGPREQRGATPWVRE